MAEAESGKPISLSEEEKSDVATKPAEAKEVENPVNAASVEVVTEKVETPAAAVEESTEASPAPAEESTEANSTAENSGEDAPAAAENSDDAEDTPEIKAALLNMFIKILRLPQQIFASQPQTKLGIASHDILSTIVVLLQKEKVLQIVISFPSIIVPYVLENGSTDGTSKGRMALFRDLCRRYNLFGKPWCGFLVFYPPSLTTDEFVE